jgi:F420-0:gamma-glutamyl ligase-like protein
MVPIYKTFKKSEIAFIKSLLIDADILFFIDNENAAGIAVGQTTGFMSVMVPESEEERARELLKEVIK